MGSETKDETEFVCCNVFRPCYGPSCKFHEHNRATPTPPADGKPLGVLSEDTLVGLPADVQAVVAHVGQMAEHYLALADQTDNAKMRDVYERDGNALRTLLAHLQRTEAR